MTFMNTTLAILGLGGGELIIVLVAVLILFGAKRIPEFAKGLGQGIKEFKKASREVTDEIQRAVDEDHTPPPQKKLAPPVETSTESAHTTAAPKA